MTRGVNKDSVCKMFEFEIFLTPPQKNIMMFIKLFVLIGFDLHFPLISSIYKLHQIKALFHSFQLSPCFILYKEKILTDKVT